MKRITIKKLPTGNYRVSGGKYWKQMVVGTKETAKRVAKARQKVTAKRDKRKR